MTTDRWPLQPSLSFVDRAVVAAVSAAKLKFGTEDNSESFREWAK